MPIFVVKGKKGGPAGPRELDTLVVGARSNCTLSLEDPLVAEMHCALGGERGGGFYVEDLSTSTGTYVNGVAVRGRTSLKDGDEIVCGVSRLKIALVAGRPEITLTLKEADFHYDKKADPLLWSEEEIAFGRFAPVRYGNYVAILLLLAAVPLCFVGATSEAVMDFGPLARVHRFDDPSFAHEAAGLGAESQGCATCHDPWAGATVGKCAACHQEVMAADRHPFQPTADSWTGGCAPCHQEHQGGDASELRGSAGLKSCKNCHAPELQAAIDSGAVELKPLERRLAARRFGAAAVAPTFTADVPFETFSHAQHMAAGAECIDCHVRVAEPLAGGPRSPRREFGRVAYESCATCHEPGRDAHPRAPHDAAGAPAKRFRVAWHGTDGGGGNCLSCHDVLHEKSLKSSEVADVAHGYSFASRSHAAEAAAFGAGKGSCSECHKNGVPESAALAGRPFRHGTHVAALAPKNGADALAASVACLACHQEQKESASLASTVVDGVYHGAAGDCTPCHGTSGAPSLPRREPIAAAATTARRRRIEFPHSKHMGSLTGGATSSTLANGCFACHEFRPGAAGAFDAEVLTLEKAGDCAECHETHRDVGGGACAECHKAGDSVYAARPGVSSPVVKQWPKPTGFSHYSPGHVEPTAQGRCTECHKGDAAVEGSATVSAVRLPTENDPSCRECHVRQGARFHWR